MPQASRSSNSSGRPKQHGGRIKEGGRSKTGGRSNRSGDPEAQLVRKDKDKSDQDNDIGLPRLVARIWGLVSGICK